MSLTLRRMKPVIVHCYGVLYSHINLSPLSVVEVYNLLWQLVYRHLCDFINVMRIVFIQLLLEVCELRNATGQHVVTCRTAGDVEIESGCDKKF